MQEIVKREDQELINVIRNAAIKLWDAENGPEVRACLDELERRHCTKGSVLARLARVEEDLSAFKRAHDGHSHELRPFALRTLAPTPGVSAPSVASITDMRTNSENRAWQCFEDWRALEIKKPENAGNVYEVVIVPPSHGLQYAAEIWACSLLDGRTLRDLIVGKAGTSRVDALAHLASWCQAELPR